MKDNADLTENQTPADIPPIACDEDGPYLPHPELPADKAFVNYLVGQCLMAIDDAERWWLADYSSDRKTLVRESRDWHGNGMLRHDAADAASMFRLNLIINHPRRVFRFWRVGWRTERVLRKARHNPLYKLDGLSRKETRQVLAVVREYRDDTAEIDRRLAWLAEGR